MFQPHQGNQFALKSAIARADDLGCEVIRFANDDIVFPPDRRVRVLSFTLTARLLKRTQIGVWSVSMALISRAQVVGEFGIANPLIMRKDLLPAAPVLHLRAKVPRVAHSWGQRLASRAGPHLTASLLNFKRLGGRLPGQLPRLATAGGEHSLADLSARHKLQAFLANLLASLLSDIVPAWRHANLYAQPGAPFLNLETQ